MSEIWTSQNPYLSRIGTNGCLEFRHISPNLAIGCVICDKSVLNLDVTKSDSFVFLCFIATLLSGAP